MSKAGRVSTLSCAGRTGGRLLLAVAFFLYVLVPSETFAQLKDTLQQVDVLRKKDPSADERINSFSPGQKISSFDSADLQKYRMQHVANLLAQQTPVFIKSYGFNGLATLNFRGSSAAQSTVLWNGIPIQNAALGLADVSLLPVAFINKLHVVYGSSASLWGSGNVGGAVLLESESPSFSGRKHLDISAGAGSFGQLQAGSKLSLGNKRFSFSTDLLLQQAKNDFSYADEAGNKNTTRNATLKGIAALSQLAYKASAYDILRLAAWYQDYDRQIPAALFEAYSVKKRQDASLKLLLDWNRKQETHSLYVRTAFLDDRMRFDDDTIGLHSTNVSRQFFFESGWSKNFSRRHKLLVFTPVQLLWMPGGGGTQRQSRYAAVAAYTYTGTGKRLSASGSIRAEQINEQSVLLPGVNASYNLFKELVLRASVQKTYRAPSLNELYYEPGGNRNLKAEYGWSQEVGYRFENKLTQSIAVIHDVSVFNRTIKDWILWLGGAIWTPHNIAAVRSRGIETENLASYSWHQWKFHAGINASYTLATTETSYIPGDESIGRQIPYTPRYNGQINAGFYFQSFYFNYNHCYTDYRYFNMDESGFLAAYQTANLQLSYDRKLFGHPVLLSAQVNNVYGSSYQVMKDRPMPGTNWLLGLKYTLL